MEKKSTRSSWTCVDQRVKNWRVSLSRNGKVKSDRWVKESVFMAMSKTIVNPRRMVGLCGKSVRVEQGLMQLLMPTISEYQP